MQPATVTPVHQVQQHWSMSTLSYDTWEAPGKIKLSWIRHEINQKKLEELEIRQDKQDINQMSYWVISKTTNRTAIVWQVNLFTVGIIKNWYK